MMMMMMMAWAFPLRGRDEKEPELPRQRGLQGLPSGREGPARPRDWGRSRGRAGASRSSGHGAAGSAAVARADASAVLAAAGPRARAFLFFLGELQVVLAVAHAAGIAGDVLHLALGPAAVHVALEAHPAVLHPPGHVAHVDVGVGEQLADLFLDAIVRAGVALGTLARELAAAAAPSHAAALLLERPVAVATGVATGAVAGLRLPIGATAAHALAVLATTTGAAPSLAHLAHLPVVTAHLAHLALALLRLVEVALIDR